jgi:hypothetical protein
MPGFSELDREFCIGKLEETGFVLRVIANKMSERLEHVLKILNDILQPESTLASMYEAESFSDDEKKKIFELFRKISSCHSELLLSDFGYEEESAAKLIVMIYKEWNNIKQEFIMILSKVKEAWKNQKKSKLEFGYFG